MWVVIIPLVVLLISLWFSVWPLVLAAGWFCLSSAILHGLTGERYPQHHTDVTPDYAGGLAGFVFLLSNALVAMWCLMSLPNYP